MKFARNIIKSGNIDSKNRINFIPMLESLYESLGARYQPPSLNKMAEVDFIFVVGSDVIGSCPQVASKIYKGVQNGAKLAVVDPCISNLAKGANYHLQNFPGTDLYWINGMISHLIKENKVNSDFINIHTSGFSELKKSVEEFTPSFVEKNSNIPENTLKTFADGLTKSKKAVVIVGDGLSNNVDIKKTMHGLINLCVVSGITDTNSLS
jgi:formate dehydrogenase major subunit